MFNPVRLLIALQLLGSVVAVAAAVWDVESILVSGPTLSLTGAAIAITSYRGRRTRGLLFGLTAPTLSVICWALIHGFTWSPTEAQWPISGLLFSATILVLPLGATAFFEASPDEAPRVHGNFPEAKPAKEPLDLAPFQFRLASLLKLMLVVGLALSLLRFGRPGEALAPLAAHAYFLAVLFRRHAARMAWFDAPMKLEKQLA